MIPVILASTITLVIGTLYPAYASYKALRTKTVTNQYKWMMYWIVRAVFSCFEGVSDIMLGFWLPLYLEFKVLFHLWLILPISQRSLGSSIIYQRFIHRYLLKNEANIDRSITTIQTQGYNTVIEVGKSLMEQIRNKIVQFAINAPAYAAQFIQRHGNANTNGTETPSFFAAIQSVMVNLHDQFSSVASIYDNERFEEIDDDVVVVASNRIGTDASLPNSAIGNSDGSENAEAKLTKKKTVRGRQQPKRKAANTQVTRMDVSSSDDMDLPDIDPNFDPSVKPIPL
jgi:receptor expression-enhancing protein 1/2/3/4